MAGSCKRKELSERNNSTFQEPSSVQPPDQHKNNGFRRSRMAPRLSLGGSNSTNRSGIRRESPHIQTHTQRPTQTGVELARGTEQRGSGVHDPNPLDTGESALSIQNKRHLHWKVLELIPGMNNNTEFIAPAHSSNEGRNGELDPPRIQEPSDEHTSLASSGTQKAFHQARHLDLGDHAVGRHCTNLQKVNKTRWRPGRSPAM